MYCRSAKEHEQEVAEAVEERDAEWMAMIGEMLSECREAADVRTSAIVALKELKTRMAVKPAKYEAK